MSIFNFVDLGGGNRVPYSKYEQMLQKAVDNIILSGFQDEDVLMNNLLTNCFNSNKMAVKVVTNLMGIYTKRIEEESEIMFTTMVPCHNIIEVNAKLKIIINVLEKLSLASLEYQKRHANTKKEEQMLLESDEEEEYYEEEDEFYDDEDPEYVEEEEEEQYDNVRALDNGLNIASLVHAASSLSQQSSFLYTSKEEEGVLTNSFLFCLFFTFW